MAVDYRFINFCSSIMNSKTAQRQYKSPLKKRELLAKHRLTRSQLKAVQSKDVDAIMAELRKEVDRAIKKEPIIVAIGW